MKLYVFKTLPPFLVGYTRDLRALWAMEECGVSFETHGLDCGPQGLVSEEWFKTISPYNQVPVIDDDGFTLTESGAVLLYIAETSGKLIPKDFKGKALVHRWMFAAVNNVEMQTLPIVLADMMGGSFPPLDGMRPMHVGLLPRFLGPVDRLLEQQPFLTGQEFTIADIMMVCVIREIRKTDLLKPFPHLENYRLRCQDRPAFKKVLAAYEDRLGVARGTAL